ncbi:hypothetical protein SAMN04488057_103321 [Cyclobacterium lianum]|uniref:Uncharacterized protein n=1 Tax=Cyclobacterium lianum TaxID=388280 RepID=A0A1M7LKU2_9BACT|nr:hypothetical protein [Cyclobacterium lianum]SHM78616.1 hypothetical protein SAMN04488057_103321 [Cyclobacterium lianum]
MKTQDNKNRKEEDFEDNSFDKAQEEAQDGKGPKTRKKEPEKKGDEKSRDELMRAKEADKEWSSESDKFRRDNA